MSPPRQIATATILLKRILSLKIVQLILLSIFLILFLPIIFFIIVRPTPAENINYGINFSSKYATELGLDWRSSYIKVLEDLNPSYLRLVAYWDEIEKKQNTYDFSDIKWQLEQAEKRDIKVIMTIGRKVLRYPECHEPQWWRDISNPDSKDEALLKYIEITVRELKIFDNITIWQVENEPMFPFGDCQKQTKETVEKEVSLVKSLDDRPILIQDSGEGGLWRPNYLMGDYLGISMYRRTWYNFFYVKYPIAHWGYKVKAILTGIPVERIIITELQAEPWGPVINSKLSQKDKNQTMSKHLFLDTINYAQKSGFKDIYFWGAEWWLWEMEQNNNSYFWNTAKSVIQN